VKKFQQMLTFQSGDITRKIIKRVKDVGWMVRKQLSLFIDA